MARCKACGDNIKKKKGSYCSRVCSYSSNTSTLAMYRYTLDEAKDRMRLLDVGPPWP